MAAVSKGQRLTRLRVTEISPVPDGSNPHAHIMIRKAGKGWKPCDACPAPEACKGKGCKMERKARGIVRKAAAAALAGRDVLIAKLGGKPEADPIGALAQASAFVTVEKAKVMFAEIVSAEEDREKLWRAQSSLRESIDSILHDAELKAAEKARAIANTFAQFVSYMEDLLGVDLEAAEATTIAKAAAKALEGEPTAEQDAEADAAEEAAAAAAAAAPPPASPPPPPPPNPTPATAGSTKAPAMTDEEAAKLRADLEAANKRADAAEAASKTAKDAEKATADRLTALEQRNAETDVAKSAADMLRGIPGAQVEGLKAALAGMTPEQRTAFDASVLEPIRKAAAASPLFKVHGEREGQAVPDDARAEEVKKAGEGLGAGVKAMNERNRKQRDKR